VKNSVIKHGVRFHSGPIAMMHASLVVHDLCINYFNVPFVVTCGIEKHEPPSKHSTGNGLDYRTRDIPDQIQKEEFADLVSAGLGDGFDVVLEIDHLHVEYDPK